MEHRQERRVACISFALVIVSLLLLSLLHILEPEFNTKGQLISDYELGMFGVLMSLVFFCNGGSVLFLILALWKDLQNRRGHLGGWWLVLIGIAFIGAGIFAPDRGVGLDQSPLSLSGSLHTGFGLFTIFTAPIAFTIISRNLMKNQRWSARAHQLRWTYVVAWIGLASFFGSLIIYNISPQTTATTLVSITNRFLVLTYCLWILIIGWYKQKEAKAAINS
jgi:hypothetical protein